ncbi:MAG TPA: hypothetical protein VHE12_06750 [bacterium]|nr:hypothetical protein [bacterium]
MADSFCVKHFDVKAVGNCGICNKPYCADCLDVETAKPICSNCKELKAKEALKAAVAGPGPSLNFKAAGLDDDPLGLLGGKPSAPKVEPPKTPMPSPAAPTINPADIPDLKTLGTPGPKPVMPMGSLDLNDLSAPVKPAMPAPAPKPNPGLDLSGIPAPPPRSSAPSSSPVAGIDGPNPLETPLKAKKPSLVKVWTKYLFRRSSEIFEPLARKTKVPAFLFPVLILVLLAGGVVGFLALIGKPSLKVVSRIQPLHFVQVTASQISDMDITAYSDIQNQLKTMGFTPILQVTVPQLPSSNFFDVYSKADSGTYAEILKVPSTIAPRLSFVTVFSNGVWYSTNAWASKGTTGEYLVSESFPNDTPDQLYTHHVQGLEKLKEDKDWQVSSMSENRYMAALSDHLRWFMEKNNLQAYQAEFKLWN